MARLSVNHALIVKPEGLLEVLHSDLPIDMRSYLTGTVVEMAVTNDGDLPVTVFYAVDETGQANPRAREILASLAGVHVYLTGSVGFTGLTEAQLLEAVRGVG